MKKFSWDLIDKNILVKNLDFSSFSEKGSAIPQDFYSFFNLSEQINHTNLTLVHNNQKFNAFIRTREKPSKKKYIFWDNDFLNLLKVQFPEWGLIKPHDKTNSVKIGFIKTSKPNKFKTIFSSLNIDILEEHIVKELKNRIDIKETEKLRLIKSRKGQGVYRKNLLEIEKKCRVTGVDDPNYLIASHIKPWAHSNDNEKLDGNNGLLLSPHIDKLFDNGYISFSNHGDMIVSSKISLNILILWNIKEKTNVGSFNNSQKKYLEFHRKKVLMK